MNFSVNRDQCNPASRLVLGTAQLGLPYGIANKTGKPDFKMALSIIKTAWEGGIREFDTAQGYGDSEAVLGRALSSLGISPEAKIITKLDSHHGQSLQMAIDKSLERLGISSLYGLMFHREERLDNLDDSSENLLHKFVRLGLVQHLGVSLYSPARALQALKSDIFDMIQVPANILDRRFDDAGVFHLADEKGKQVYIRSVFLQGLLLMKPEDLPANMAFAKGTIGKIDSLCAKNQYTRQEIALLYIKGKYPQAKIIIGAETPIQLEQNLNIWRNNFDSRREINDFDSWSIVDERIINPSLWP
jgi:aryl-alcohol dehydrogenase-like predicted oxidoreductase